MSLITGEIIKELIKVYVENSELRQKLKKITEICEKKLNSDNFQILQIIDEVNYGDN